MENAQLVRLRKQREAAQHNGQHAAKELNGGSSRDPAGSVV